MVSAPGKVLIAGGYLILDPDQIGLVFALSARVYVRITQEDGGDGIFTVTSPQFLNATWKYKCYNRDKDLHIEDLYAPISPSFIDGRTPESSNNYVRLTIAYVLACLPDECSFPNFSIEILADNDYYSQPSCSTYDDLVQLPQFNELNKPISEVNKTGLGSSAALITALTGALVSMLWVVDQKLSTPYAHKVVHNLAQAAHCAAQGKIGSGFDIAAAVYGSCIYRRFNPTTLETFLIDADVYTSQFRKRLASLVETKWAMEITPFTLPSGLRVVMGDVTGGSETPSMVRSVLKWKHKNAETSKIWNSLGVANRNLIDRFADIPVANKRDVVDGVLTRHHQDNLSSKSSLIKTLNDVAECFEVSYS